MEKLILKFIGVDSWSRPVYEDVNGKLFKDTNCDHGPLALCTAYGGFEGEPDTPIECIAKYQGVEVEITGKEDEPTPEEKYKYRMLSRLKMDCDYYLGNGNRHANHLWSGDEEQQISKMKTLHAAFDTDKKPEWLTWDDILTYEKEMVG